MDKREIETLLLEPDADVTEVVDPPRFKGGRCCCGCQSLVRSGDGVWFRCARDLLQIDPEVQKVEIKFCDGVSWTHRESVAFERTSVCVYRFVTSPEAKIGGDEDAPAIAPPAPTQPVPEQSTVRRRARYPRIRRACDVPDFVCPDCGQHLPGLTTAGTRRIACSDPRCNGRQWGRRRPSYGNYHAKLDPASVVAIRQQYADGSYGYRLLGRMYNVSPGVIRDVVKGITHRGVK